MFSFTPEDNGISLSRRRFVQGIALGGLTAGLGLRSTSARAQLNAQQGAQQLRGTEFNLDIAEQAVNFTGTDRIGTTVNGNIPAPTLHWREGDTVTLNVHNSLPVTSSIHWHGIILENKMDGVPGLTFDGIPAGETFKYRFKLEQSGTYWYHSHSGFQEQTGVYGAIVIDPIKPDPIAYDRDYVITLSDWTDENPTNVYSKLKKLSHYYNFSERTTSDLWREVKAKGVAQTWNERAMWNQMRMNDRDLSDVTGYTYTFLMNGQTPNKGWLGLFKRGEKIRLRFINAAAMTFFDVRIPGLKMTVVASDGQLVEPVSVDEFRIGVAETYDVIVEPKDDTAYTLFAQALDRTGYARGTLTPDPELQASVPDMDALPILSHTDMGMDMSGMDHGAHAGHNMGGMDHSKMAGMDHSKMADMDHSKMAGMDHSKMAGMDHSKPQVTDTKGKAGYGSDTDVNHVKTEYGPHIDMRSEAPLARLDDPGVGLRNNGRRVLVYSDLKNLLPTSDPREPTREIQLHLTGNMSRYMWSINGIKFADAEPLQLHYGERLRITLVNDTMMNHPIHLHGLWSDLETGDPSHIPRKHTVVVQPGSKISYLVTADAKGRWAYHCHLLYHMPGMFREVNVS